MNIPNLPLEPFMLKDGENNPTWKFWFEQLITTLQNNLSNEGYVIPSLTQDDINLLNTSQNIGRIIYNSTTSRMMQNLSGTFVNIGL